MESRTCRQESKKIMNFFSKLILDVKGKEKNRIASDIKNIEKEKRWIYVVIYRLRNCLPFQLYPPLSIHKMLLLTTTKKSKNVSLSLSLRLAERPFILSGERGTCFMWINWAKFFGGHLQLLRLLTIFIVFVGYIFLTFRTYLIHELPSKWFHAKVVPNVWKCQMHVYSVSDRYYLLIHV